MYGVSYFKPVWGEHDVFGTLKTTNLALSDADANLGTIKMGKAMDIVANSETEMKYSTGATFMGFLMTEVSLLGVTDLALYQQVMQGWLYQPIQRGMAVGIAVPRLNSWWEFEDLGTVGVNRLVITSGGGAISGSTAVGTPLTIDQGGWRVAANNERVWAEVLRANLTPEVGSNIRIRVKILAGNKLLPNYVP